MSKEIKILLGVIIVSIVLAASVFGYLYLKQSQLSKKKTPATVVKSEEKKELESIDSDILGSETLDLTELDNISNELDQIDISGI